jgi:hypothetical protein
VRRAGEAGGSVTGHYITSLPTVDDESKAAATALVATNAQGPDDCRELLGALGLISLETYLAGETDA